MSGPTHYDVLGVAPSANVDQIREAYRRLAREHHPDRTATNGRTGGDVSMPAINEAYRVLNDPALPTSYTEVMTVAATGRRTFFAAHRQTVSSE